MAAQPTNKSNTKVEAAKHFLDVLDEPFNARWAMFEQIRSDVSTLRQQNPSWDFNLILKIKL